MTDKVAIVGARDASKETAERVRDFVRRLPIGTVVVSGGAAGVDRIAAATARERGLETEEYVPGYEARDIRLICNPAAGQPGGRDAQRIVVNGPVADSSELPKLRNTLLALACTRMVAFVQGSRGGTWDAINQAKRFRRPVEVIG